MVKCYSFLAVWTDTFRAAECTATPATILAFHGFVFEDTFAAAFAFELVAGGPVFICHIGIFPMRFLYIGFRRLQRRKDALRLFPTWSVEVLNADSPALCLEGVSASEAENRIRLDLVEHVAGCSVSMDTGDLVGNKPFHRLTPFLEARDLSQKHPLWRTVGRGFSYFLFVSSFSHIVTCSWMSSSCADIHPLLSRWVSLNSPFLIGLMLRSVTVNIPIGVGGLSEEKV